MTARGFDASGMPVRDAVVEAISLSGGECAWINPRDAHTLSQETGAYGVFEYHGRRYAVFVDVHMPRGDVIARGPNGLVHAINVGK